MNNQAISYRRFSSAKQRKGTSFVRQMEATEAYCKENGLTLVKELEDEALSGWNGENLDDTAALGQLLKSIKAGVIPKGTTLIVENLDRITRAELTTAVHLFTGILVNGIDIVTTMDKRRYTKGADPTDIIIAVTILMRGNEESETKSKRILDVWKNKRAAIIRGEFVKMTQHPNWLEVRNGKYEPNEDAKKTVQMVFEMYASGMGSHVIAKQLNKLGRKPFARAKKSTFTFSSIERLLKSEAVIGTCDVVNPPKKGYWPAVISEDLWYKVQALRQQNNHYKGTRNDAQKVNFLGGLAVCAKCEPKWEKAKDTMNRGKMVRYSCTGTNGERYHYLTCSNAKYGEHSLDLVPYEQIQTSFIHGIGYNGFLEPFYRAKTDTEIQDNTPELQGRIIEAEKNIARVAKLVARTASDQLEKELVALEQEAKDLRARLEAETIRVKGATNSKAAIRALLDNWEKHINENGFRMALRDFLRGVIAKVVVGRDEKRCPFYSVHFKDCKDVVSVTMSDPREADKSYRVSLNGEWQVGIREFA